MSDLQIVLIVIGAIIIVAVLAFNWWQERRFHQQVEHNFSKVKTDALLKESLPNEAELNELELNELDLSDPDLYEVKEIFDHEDFHINHDSIQEVAAGKSEPLMHTSVSHNESSLRLEPNAVEPDKVFEREINDAAVTENISADNDSAAYSEPLAEVDPATHEGIKAIFEDVFNKNLNSASVPETNDGNLHKLAEEADHGAPILSLPAMLHAQIDLIAVLDLTVNATVVQISKALKEAFDSYDKPVFIHVQTPDQRWLLLSDIASRPEFSDQKVSKVACSLQLADRAGPVLRSVVNRFQLAVESLGLDIDAHVEWQSTGDAAADAVALDAFCIDVDKTMGFHLMHGENGSFTGTKLRGLAEAQGLELATDGTFKYYDEAAKKQASGSTPAIPSFVMFNRDHYPFNPEMLRSSVIKGVTFQLDIPHVGNCTEAFNHMVLVARQMETGLHAQLVDDNNRPLGDAQIEKIRHQLKIIQATMLTKGITPGSDVAHRLFS